MWISSLHKEPISGPQLCPVNNNKTRALWVTGLNAGVLHQVIRWNRNKAESWLIAEVFSTWSDWRSGEIQSATPAAARDGWEKPESRHTLISAMQEWTRFGLVNAPLARTPTKTPSNAYLKCKVFSQFAPEVLWGKHVKQRRTPLDDVHCYELWVVRAAVSQYPMVNGKICITPRACVMLLRDVLRDKIVLTIPMESLGV